MNQKEEMGKLEKKPYRFTYTTYSSKYPKFLFFVCRYVGPRQVGIVYYSCNQCESGNEVQSLENSFKLNFGRVIIGIKY